MTREATPGFQKFSSPYFTQKGIGVQKKVRKKEIAIVEGKEADEEIENKGKENCLGT